MNALLYPDGSMRRLLRLFFVGACWLLSSCGGGSGSVNDAPVITIEDRVASATATARDQSLCQAIAPFYWEIGDRASVLASGRVGGDSSPAANTVMSIASASKFLYAAYVAQVRGGRVDPVADVRFLNFTSGYSAMSALGCSGSVDECLTGSAGVRNDAEATGGVFHYNGGHMQKHASVMGLGTMGNRELATELKSRLGADVDLVFTSPQPAGGASMSATAYANFLRKLLVGGSLQLGSLLSSNPVCTLPGRCPAAASSPSPEAWHYGLGHWIEDDPASSPPGDGAFSSIGAFGFYPWISAQRDHYGVLARQSLGQSGGYGSVRCGRLIRKAWTEGRPQTQ